ncbi:MAG: hypothetical protein KDD70_12795, partial [Bdellovibrionales bacterium]|nr:hypothetical protein [Bdellovibrionales bacterium]
MFAFLELPRAFDVTRDTFVSLSEQVVSLLLEHSEERLVRSNESLDEIVKAKKGVYWVSEGSLLLQYQDKRILAFETNECIGLDTLAGDSPFSFANELAVGIRFIEIEKLGALFESVPDLAT